MKVYVASSWRNHLQRGVVHLCRSMGHEVYDFREPTEGNHGFSWHEIDPSIPRGPACGRSAHLEAGWAAGAGRLTVGLLADGEPDLMWKMLDHLIVRPDELFDVLGFPAEAKYA